MLPSTELRKRLKDSYCPWELVKAGHHERWELPGGFVFILSQGASAAGHAKQNYLKQIDRAESAYLASLPKAVNAPSLVPMPAPFRAFTPQPLPLVVETPKPAPMPVATPTPGLQTFNFGPNPIRIVMQDDEPWWMAVDVCAALDISDTRQAVGRLDEDERVLFNTGVNGNAYIVNESGLYALVLGSRKPEAKAFKRWITHEVIPALRKTGTYTVSSKNPFQDMSRLEWMEYSILLEREKVQNLQTIGCQAEEIQVLTEVAEETSAQLERLAGAPIGSMCLEEAAKHLQVRPRWFNDWLREIRWIYRGPLTTPLAYQTAINAGWLCHTIQKYSNGPDYKMVVVTPAGLVKLSEMLEARPA